MLLNSSIDNSQERQMEERISGAQIPVTAVPMLLQAHQSNPISNRLNAQNQLMEFRFLSNREASENSKEKAIFDNKYDMLD